MPAIPDRASDIAFTPAGTIAATDVQAAIVEVAGDLSGYATASDLATHIADSTDPHGASMTLSGTLTLNDLPVSRVTIGDNAALRFGSGTNAIRASEFIAGNVFGTEGLWLTSSPNLGNSTLTSAGGSTFINIPGSGGRVGFLAQGAGQVATISDTGNATLTGSLTAGGTVIATSYIQGSQFIDGQDAARVNSSGMTVKSAGLFAFSSSGGSAGTVDAAIGRASAGVVEINSGASGTLRDLSARAATLTGSLTAAGVALASGGEATFAGDGLIRSTTGGGSVTLRSGGSGQIKIHDASTSAADTSLVRACIGSHTQSSGVTTFFEVMPTISQSGTAGYTVLRVNANTGSGTGSGTKLLLNLQEGGVSRCTVANDGSLTAASLNLGGATLLDVLTATATLDFAATDPEDKTISVTGAAVGDVVHLGVPHAATGASPSDVTYTAWVSSADTVTVRKRGATDPTSGTFRVSVLKF